MRRLSGSPSGGALHSGTPRCSPPSPDGTGRSSDTIERQPLPDVAGDRTPRADVALFDAGGIDFANVHFVNRADLTDRPVNGWGDDVEASDEEVVPARERFAEPNRLGVNPVCRIDEVSASAASNKTADCDSIALPRHALGGVVLLSEVGFRCTIDKDRMEETAFAQLVPSRLMIALGDQLCARRSTQPANVPPTQSTR